MSATACPLCIADIAHPKRRRLRGSRAPFDNVALVDLDGESIGSHFYNAERHPERA